MATTAADRTREHGATQTDASDLDPLQHDVRDALPS